MTTSSYTWQPRFEQNFCHGHDEAGKILEKDKDNAARSASTFETTPEDYTRFLRAVLNRQGLREPSWKEMFSPQIRIRSKRQFGPLAQVDGIANDAIHHGEQRQRRERLQGTARADDRGHVYALGVAGLRSLGPAVTTFSCHTRRAYPVNRSSATPSPASRP